MDGILTEIANMRMETEFELKNEADAVLGAAVRAIGPQAFLEVLPLNLGGDLRKDQAGRAWLLPLMKSHIRNAPLRYFVDTMLPLADSLAVQSRQFASKGREIEAKVFSALSQQVWALLGGFFNVPVDILQSFTPSFSERLVAEMLESPDLRPTICGALQTLLVAVHALADDDSGTGPLTKQQALAAQVHLAQFAPSYLAQLFNVFAQSPGANRGYMVNTITAFLAVITPAEISATFAQVCAMLDEALKTHKPPAAAELTERYLEAHAPPEAHTLLDLAIIMTPYLDTENSLMLVRAAHMLAKQSEDQILQKKGYKAISRLAEQPAGSAAHQLIESTMSAQLIPMLVESAESVAISSRRERLSLIALLSRNLADDQLHFIPAMLSEVILGTKEANERARSVAFDALLTMGKRMAQGGAINMAAVTGDISDDESGQQVASTEEFFKMISAGLAAQTPHMISATIAAISRVLFEYQSFLSMDFVVELMSTVLMFVVNNNREIAKASLGFVKIIAVILPKEVLEPHLAEIVTSILKWSHEFKNKMRLKCRHILDRLVRRLGLDAVEKVMPEEHMKLLANMRKRQQRSKRGKEATGAAGGQQQQQAESNDAAAQAGATAKKTFGSAYEDVLYGSESELEDSDDDEPSNPAAKGKGAAAKADRKNGNAKGANAPTSAKISGAWIKEDADGPLDFLDRSAFTHFSTSNPTTKARRTPIAPKMKGGKFVFEDPEEEARKAAVAASAAAAAAAQTGGEADGEDYYLQSLTSKDAYYHTPGQKVKFPKRKAGDDDDDIEMASDTEDATATKAKPAPTKRGKDNSGNAIGREFRAKKAQGDVKRGNIDPFAYIPLNPKSMKKGAVSVKGNSKKEKRMRNMK
ncbi:pre-rRNA processing protein [Coemansia aciculifera]|nr:pre-rRNA processing protein [Coemansia aciculifera]